jgi:adenosylmethionine-8-amino-7-oxononanoate aminotransferase
MPQGDILGLAPPLCISKSEIDILISGIAKVIEESKA